MHARYALHTAALALITLGLSSPALLAGERVTNGGFGSSTGWSLWTQRGTLGQNFNYSGGDCPSGGSGACLRINGSGTNGGPWQQLSLVNGQNYTLSLYSKDWGTSANNGWAEVHVGTSAPSNGSDYGNGSTQRVKWDTFACDNWNGNNSGACVQNNTSFTATNDTMYIVLKSGVGSGNCRMSWDSISVDGQDPVSNSNPTIVSQTVSAGTLVADNTTQYTVSVVIQDTDGTGDIDDVRAMFHNGGAFNTGNGRGYLAWGDNDADITHFGGSWTIGGNATGGGRWGYENTSFGAATYITPVSCTTSTNANQRTVTWTFTVKSAWAIAYNQKARAFSRDASDATVGWTDSSANYAVACGTNRVNNGDFSSGSTGWTQWQERGSATYNYTTTGGNCPAGGSGNCLRMTKVGDFNGGVYQALSLVSGQNYTISALSKDVGSTANAAWAELRIGATAPSNGSDYTGTQYIKWDTFGCDNWDGDPTTACVQSTTTFNASASTMYLVLKNGQTGGATLDVSWDSLQICGQAPPSRTLTVTAGANGSITQPSSSPQSYPQGTVVNLEATPNGGFEFVNWTGDTTNIASTTSASTTITMNADASITANFAGIQRTLNATASLGGTIRINGGGATTSSTTNHSNAASVSIEAIAGSGYVFSGWTEVSTALITNRHDKTTTITMNSNATIAAAFSPTAGNSLTNGDFSNGTTGWTNWNQNGTPSRSVTGGDETVLSISGSNSFNGGVYQQFSTGGAGSIVNLTGYWRTASTKTNMWAEVMIINSSRTPTNGVDESNGVNNAIMMYRNTSAAGWDNSIPLTSPGAYNVSFTAAGDTATILLKVGGSGTGTADVYFDNLEARSVPAPTTVNSLPTNFTKRTYDFGFPHMVCITQNPVSKLLYAIRNGSNDPLYRINVGGGSITATFIANIGSVGSFDGGAQGIAFDPSGNIYVSSREGDIVKGTDTNGDPNTDTFSFAQILDLPELQLGTFHGVGGLVVGPDNLLYISSGSESFYGYLTNGALETVDPNWNPSSQTGRLNARIITSTLTGGLNNVNVFAEGIRNSFDIAFRADGKLFGVENGPNTNCDYAEEFNMIQSGLHYGFPYKYGSDLSGSDSSIACQNSGGGNSLGPPALPGGLVVQPAWANYGPDSKPTSGQPGYNGGGPYYGYHPHSSPNGITFYDPDEMDGGAALFPDEFHDRAFVARFGQLENLGGAYGFDILSMRLDEAYSGFFSNTFFTGIGRAMDVFAARNGRLYIIVYSQETSGTASGSSNSLLHEISYTSDATPPNCTITRTSPGACPTNASTLSFDIDFDEPVSGFVVGDITFNAGGTGGTLSGFSGSGANYSVNVTGITNSGTVSISLGAGVVIDGGGNGNTGCGPETCTIDKDSPTCNIVRTSPASCPTSASTVSYDITFNEPVTGFVVGDITFNAGGTGGTLSGFSGSGDSYSVNVTGLTSSGTISLSLGAGVATDSTNNGNTGCGPVTCQIDKDGPTCLITRTSPASCPTNASTVSFSISFDESVTGFTQGDITLNAGGTGGSLSGFSGSGANYSVNVTGIASSGTISLSVPGGVAQDSQSNLNTGCGPETCIIDKTGPDCLITKDSPDPSNLSTVTFSIDFDESVTGFTQSDITLSGSATGKTLSNFQGSGANYSVDVSGINSSGTVAITLSPGVVTDGSGNGNNGCGPVTYTIDKTPPSCTVTRTSPANCPSGASTVSFAINFNESVGTSFTQGDIVFDAGGTGGSLSNFAGSGANYSVDVTGINDTGTLSVAVALGAVTDLVGNNSTQGCGPASCTIDLSGPTCDIARTSPASCPTNAATLSFEITFSEGVNDFDIGDIVLDNGGTGGVLSNFQSPGGGCVEPVSNGSFSSGGVNWTAWTERGSATRNFASGACPSGGTAPCLRVNSAGNFNGGVYQTLSLVSGQSYTLSLVSRDIGSTAGGPWSEVLVGTTQPVNGSDYTAGSPSGTALLAKWDTLTCDNFNGNQTTACVDQQLTFTASATTMYVVLKTGQDPEIPGQIADVAWDDVRLCDSTSNDRFTVDVTGLSGQGTVSLSVNAGVATDDGGNANLGCGPETCAVDRVAPGCVVTKLSPDPTNANTVSYGITFNESVTGFTQSDLTLGGTAPGKSLSGFSGSGANYTVNVVGIGGSGSVTLAVNAGGATDAVGNTNTGCGPTAYTIDKNPPNITDRDPDPGVAVADPFTTLDVTFDEAVTGLDATDLTLDGTPATGISGSGAGPYTFTFNNPANGVVNVSLGTGFSDLATNAFGGANWIYLKNVPPRIDRWVSIKPHGSKGNMALDLDPVANGLNANDIVAEPRQDGLQEVRAEFSETVELATGTIAQAVAFEVSANGVSGWSALSPQAVALLDDNDVVSATGTQLRFLINTSGGNGNGQPTDAQYVRFRILTSRLRSITSQLYVEDNVAADLEVIVRSRIGDVTSLFDITSTDVTAIRTAILIDDPFGPANAKYDVLLNGIIDTLDMAYVKSRIGG